MSIQLRGVRVHNLKSIDLDIPYEKLVVFCGVSGSGKSSLAMDTLYAEGQRRYIESFSAYTRQFLEKLEKPEADHIDGIPPAAAVTVRGPNHYTRATIGTATETVYYLRLLYSKIGKLYCYKCGREVRYDSPESILDFLNEIRSENDLKAIIAFEPVPETYSLSRQDFQAKFQEHGFLRGTVFGREFRFDEDGLTDEEYQKLRQNHGETVAPQNEVHDEKDLFSDKDFYDPDSDNGHEDSLEIKELSRAESETEETPFEPGEPQHEPEMDASETLSLFAFGENLIDAQPQPEQPPSEPQPESQPPPFLIYVDRVTLGKTDEKRIHDSLETALNFGNEKCYVQVESGEWRVGSDPALLPTPHSPFPTLCGFSRNFSCADCRIEYPPLEPKLFSFNSPLGACPVCEGFGNLVAFDLNLIIPNPGRTIRDGAIAPWNTPSYKSRLGELLERSEELGIPVDIPYEKLTDAQKKIILSGCEKNGNRNKYEGLSQFFEKLQKQKYKMHIRVFLSRWRSYRQCPSCNGSRLRNEALAVKVGGKNIAELCSLSISELIPLLENHPWTDWEIEVARTPLAQAVNRLRYLEQVGLGYLTLDRTLRTLSGGEQRRIGLTSALGSSLVNMLYVLDEPSIGLHPQDTDRLLTSILSLRDRGNTVVVVEHEEAILRSADRIVEIGPGAGQTGGQLVFEGTPQEIVQSKTSLTGSYLSGKRSGGAPGKRRPTHGFLDLTGACGHNLKNIDIAFPLGVLCLVTGVSGSGKSTLIQETLYPALARKLGKENAPIGLPYTQMLGTGNIDDVVMVDQSSIGRSPRSNPVTYLKIFDEIRSVFAETPDAKTKNFTAGHFSFNIDGGRCNTCKGDGYIEIDMQFMADLFVKCPQCHGKRYQKDVLEILYRGKNIADVLEMTAREAFAFFRGQTKVQQKLKRLMDVGLDYLRLGQPANTLSGGESQRLKLATYLSTMKKGRCVFLLDEPTTGLHFSDIVQLLDCFDALIDTGHSLIVVEHNLQMMRAADYIIDLGPGPSEEGGRVVATGTPEEIVRNPNSLTGRFLTAG
ncbi:MAG: excinuclease ABC subunit UvrA [Planctomycetaceae bacterium]|nr:excinuclease ABC subunit UvrA [Planctomycetaceae bacterium]